MIRLIIVDDHAVLRDGLKTILESEQDIQVIGEAESGNLALNLVATLKPDVVLTDINMPGMTGIEVTKAIKQIDSNVKVLILTMHSHQEYLMAAIKEGADGYLLKDAPSDHVIEAIRTVHAGESVIHPSLTKKLMNYHQQQLREEKTENMLTERERDVLICLVEGLTNKEIGERLFVSEKTVKIHVSNIFKKLNVKSRSQVVIYAMQNGLVPFPEQR
ncbi:DNA-binding NarL/FixJ family response regulator [Chryseomicrobium aureum]|uniref:response regulator n=1 Tax=Chryseomicrobium aureum TaxID=1441723 RepID=UPI00195C7836|nr:response regulator transcription factor [Chryseomicrobium aureum]MBM7706782.1 DNA-binding NarL/FixJ family response regulator [Chryseomicrobium aureum]